MLDGITLNRMPVSGKAGNVLSHIVDVVFA